MKRTSLAFALFMVACAGNPAPKSEDSAKSAPSEPAASVAPAPTTTAAATPTPEPVAANGATAVLVRCKTSDRISGKDAQTLVAEGAALVDVRSPTEYAEKHVPGAKNVPVDELEKRMGELPKDHPVVVYCRSGMRAARAASLLRAAGYTAHNMGGVDAWGSTDC